jgi:hypothetical protein
MSAGIQRTIRCYIPEGGTLKNNRCDNLNDLIIYFLPPPPNLYVCEHLSALMWRHSINVERTCSRNKSSYTVPYCSPTYALSARTHKILPIESIVFGDLRHCSPVELRHCFGAAHFLHFMVEQRVKQVNDKNPAEYFMLAVRFATHLHWTWRQQVKPCPSTTYYIQSHQCENLKPNIVTDIYK